MAKNAYYYENEIFSGANETLNSLENLLLVTLEEAHYEQAEALTNDLRARFGWLSVHNEIIDYRNRIEDLRRRKEEAEEHLQAFADTISNIAEARSEAPKAKVSKVSE